MEPPLLKFYDAEFNNLKSRAESAEKDLRELTLLNINQKRDFLVTLLNICFGIIGSAFAAVYGFQIFRLNLFLILSIISLLITVFYIIIFLQSLLLSESALLDKMMAFNVGSFRETLNFVLTAMKNQMSLGDFSKQYEPMLRRNVEAEEKIRADGRNYSDIHYMIIVIFFLSGVLLIVLSFIFRDLLVLS